MAAWIRWIEQKRAAQVESAQPVARCIVEVERQIEVAGIVQR
jgi:hypothetical protein